MSGCSQMKRQTLRPWRPIPDVPDRLYLQSMHDDGDDLTILLRVESSQSVLRLVYEAPIGYRSINETYRLRTWDMADMRALPSLLIIDNSKWIKWLIEEAVGILDDRALVHYAIYTPDDCIDVVADIAPTVEWRTQ